MIAGEPALAQGSGGSSSDPLTPEQAALVEPYWALRNEALLALTGMITPEEVYDSVEDEWDVVCQGVFDAFAETRAALKATVPEGQELNPVIAEGLNAEQQGWIALCFDGGELVLAHNRAIETAQFLQYETAQATRFSTSWRRRRATF
jgi:hypothetical protein